MTSVGENIKNIRKKNNITQEELAKKLSVTRQAVSSWENGKTEPDIETLTNITQIFDISIDELLDNDIRDIMEKKIINTEKLTNKNTRNIKILLITLYFIILSGLIYIIIYYSTKRDFTNKYQSVYTCTLGEEDNIHNLDTGIFFIYWDDNEDGTFSVIIEINSDDPIYDEHKEKGIYGNGNVIYGRMNAGTSLVDAIDAVNYVKNLFLYHGATCR
jgi:transcriptional regulator with XRE-family HTH domain